MTTVVGFSGLFLRDKAHGNRGHFEFSTYSGPPPVCWRVVFAGRDEVYNIKCVGTISDIPEYNIIILE